MIKNVMASASDTECVALFINSREAIVIRTTFEIVLHPQPATPMQVDNSTCNSIIKCKEQKNVQRQWTCIFLGEEIAQNKNT